LGVVLPNPEGWGAWASEDLGSLPDRAYDWSDVFRHLERARRVGRRFLRAYPREADQGFLIAQVDRRLREASEELRRAGPDSPEREPLARLVSRAVARDFAAFRMVEIEGWHLSETEARLSALAALDRRRA